MSSPSCSGSAASRRPARPRSALVEDDEPVGEREQLVEVLGHQQDRGARGASGEQLARTYSVAPTSRPRVGCETTISRGSRARTRASSTFWMLPPDRVATAVVRAGADGEPLDELARPAPRCGRSSSPPPAAEVVDPLQDQVGATGRSSTRLAWPVLGDAPDARGHHLGRDSAPASSTSAHPDRPASAGASRTAPPPARSGRCRTRPRRPRSRRPGRRGRPRAARASPGCRRRTARRRAAPAGRPGRRSVGRCDPEGRPSDHHAGQLPLVGVARRACPTSRPRRSTVTRSEIARTSASLWLMNTTASPSATSRAASRTGLDLLGHEHRGRLVEDQDPAVAGERLEDLDPLLLPDRQVAHARVGLDADPEALRRPRARRRRAPARSSRSPRRRGRAPGSRPRSWADQREVLGDHADPGGDRVARATGWPPARRRPRSCPRRAA